jgi:hypothetical protein
MTYKEGETELSLWNEKDGMYYDAIQFGPGNSMQLPVRSLVGLIPLYATLVLEPAVINRFPGFKKRMEWFLDNRPEVSARNMANMKGFFLFYFSVCTLLLMVTFVSAGGKEERRLLALASKERLVKILEKMLDEDEFLSEHGIRSCVKFISSPSMITNSSLVYPSYIKSIHGGWTFMVNVMRLATGQGILALVCLEGIRTGEARYVKILVLYSWVQAPLTVHK